jgi:hypothetical protein
VQPSTSREAERVAPAAILTIRRQRARIIPPDQLPDTPRSTSARAMWRDWRTRGMTNCDWLRLHSSNFAPPLPALLASIWEHRLVCSGEERS